MFHTNYEFFLKDETGAVTVDWVVLTAAIVGLGMAVMSVFTVGFQDLTGDTVNTIRTTDIMTDPFNRNP